MILYGFNYLIATIRCKSNLFKTYKALQET